MMAYIQIQNWLIFKPAGLKMLSQVAMFKSRVYCHPVGYCMYFPRMFCTINWYCLLQDMIVTYLASIPCWHRQIQFYTPLSPYQSLSSHQISWGRLSTVHQQNPHRTKPIIGYNKVTSTARFIKIMCGLGFNPSCIQRVYCLGIALPAFISINELGTA